MKLKEGSILYVRIDYEIGEKEVTEQDGLDSMEYLQRVAGERFLLAGVLGDMEIGKIDGAMIVYEAADLEEARKIADQDPIIAGGFYRYEINQWNLMVLSGSNGESQRDWL